jgi:hypothetical protein
VAARVGVGRHGLRSANARTKPFAEIHYALDPQLRRDSQSFHNGLQIGQHCARAIAKPPRDLYAPNALKTASALLQCIEPTTPSQLINDRPRTVPCFCGSATATPNNIECAHLRSRSSTARVDRLGHCNFKGDSRIPSVSARP